MRQRTGRFSFSDSHHEGFWSNLLIKVIFSSEFGINVSHLHQWSGCEFSYCISLIFDVLYYLFKQVYQCLYYCTGASAKPPLTNNFSIPPMNSGLLTTFAVLIQVVSDSCTVKSAASTIAWCAPSINQSLWRRCCIRLNTKGRVLPLLLASLLSLAQWRTPGMASTVNGRDSYILSEVSTGSSFAIWSAEKRQ